MAAPLISIERISKRYGSATVLDDVSLDVGEGEFVALLGPSGCGKTTLLRSVAGFITPEAGDIRIAGRSVIDLPPDRRPVNMVFQNYALFPHLTVARNVAFGPERARLPAAEIRGIVAESLGTVGMSGFADRFPAQLSGGQQQRVALARAIANKPKVLLLDEPLGALDLQLRKRMQLELKHLQQKLGITFVFVTHDQEEALVMADRIVVMRDGRIVQVGTGRDIYRAPQTRYVAEFIGEANLLSCRIEDGVVLAEGGGMQARLLSDGPAGRSGPCVMMVRPEDVNIGAPPDGASAIAGHVREVVFVGNRQRVYCRAFGEAEVMAELAGDTPAELAAGAPVTLWWRRDACRILFD